LIDSKGGCASQPPFFINFNAQIFFLFFEALVIFLTNLNTSSGEIHSKNIKMQKIKTALVGYGSVGQKMHAPLISVCKDLELTAVVERSTELAQTKYPHITTYKSLEDLLAADAADLIVIVTPNEFHFAQALLALQHGKHVVVDKPVTLKAEEAETLKALAESKGLVLSVFQNRRWDGDILTIKEILAKDTLGRLVHFESHFDRFRPEVSDNWREKNVLGNGITFDLGTHLIDQVVLLFGKPEWIYAEILTQRTNALADDFFDITLMYQGMKARVTGSVLMNAPMMRFLILGEKGSYSKYGLDIQEKKFKENIVPAGDDWGAESPDSYGKVFLENDTISYPTVHGDYRHFYQNIADAIRKESPLAVKMEDAITVLKIIEAAFESHATGKRIYQKEKGW
jgi:scyllo-inositol 2-dehydrogenase (NADP+)